MNIVLLIRSLNYGGAERQFVVLAKELHNRSHQVTVVVFYPGGPLEEDLHNAGVQLRSLNKKSRWDIVGLFLRLIRFIHREKPDFVYSYLAVPNIVTVVPRLLFRRIKFIWGVGASNVDLKQYDWLTRSSNWLECKFSGFPDLIIANSHSALNYAVANGFPKSNMVVIPNGIDTDQFCPDSLERKRVRKEWDVSENQKLIGLVGRLDPMKDHPTFLKAAALLGKQREDIRFVCVGEGLAHYRNQLHTLSKELGLTNRIIWAGARPDMPAVYNAFDIATSSSSYGEGWSNVIGEAMACGIPCVVTDVGDSAWIVGKNGIVVKPNDVNAV